VLKQPCYQYQSTAATVVDSMALKAVLFTIFCSLPFAVQENSPYLLSADFWATSTPYYMLGIALLLFSGFKLLASQYVLAAAVHLFYW